MKANFALALDVVQNRVERRQQLHVLVESPGECLINLDGNGSENREVWEGADLWKLGTIYELADAIQDAESGNLFAWRSYRVEERESRDYGRVGVGEMA